MKFRLMLASIVAVTASLSFAEGAEEDILNCTNFVGVSQVVPPAKNNESVVIAIPWVSYSDSGVETPISASNLVLTAGLTPEDKDNSIPGDKLAWYNPSTKVYETWVLKKASDGVKYWDSVNEVSAGDKWGQSSPACGTMLARGSAALLQRQDTSKKIYLSGNVAGAVESITWVLGESTALFAPPSVAGGDFSKAENVEWSGFKAGDVIHYPLANGVIMTATWSASTGFSGGRGTGARVLCPGTGAWFVPKAGTTGTRSVTWKARVLP